MNVRASAETERLFTFTITAAKDDESLDSLVLVRTGAAIAEGASQPRRSPLQLDHGMTTKAQTQDRRMRTGP